MNINWKGRVAKRTDEEKANGITDRVPSRSLVPNDVITPLQPINVGEGRVMATRVAVCRRPARRTRKTNSVDDATMSELKRKSHRAKANGTATDERSWRA